MTGPEIVGGPLDGLVADGQAIGVRVVLDLTARPLPSGGPEPLPVVEIPDTVAALLLLCYEPYAS